MSKFALLYSEKLREYDLGHVLTQDRYQDFMGLFQESVGNREDFEVVEPPSASHEELRLVHTEDYIRRVEKCDGIDPFDTPLSPGLIRAAKLLAGAGKCAGKLVQSGAYSKAFVVGGGVQHANREREKGFGVFSDVGVCAENLMQNHSLQRILIIDTDAHAGDGVYEIFATDPQVLFLSLHQDPHTLYPGKGYPHEIGRDQGKGYSVNISLPPESTPAVYEHVLNEIFIPLAEEFKPEIMLMVDGSDPHFTDRITRMGMTLEGIKMVGRIVAAQAEKLCEGKVIDFIGSGYSPEPNVVSLGWLASIAGLTGMAIRLEEPVPIPPMLQADYGLDEARRVVHTIHKRLSPYWRCFA